MINLSKIILEQIYFMSHHFFQCTHDNDSTHQPTVFHNYLLKTISDLISTQFLANLLFFCVLVGFL